MCVGVGVGVGVWVGGWVGGCVSSYSYVCVCMYVRVEVCLYCVCARARVTVYQFLYICTRPMEWQFLSVVSEGGPFNNPMSLEKMSSMSPRTSQTKPARPCLLTLICLAHVYVKTIMGGRLIDSNLS
jgi:hypothetical protein